MKKKNFSEEGKDPAFRNRRGGANVSKICKSCKSQKNMKVRPYNVVNRPTFNWITDEVVNLQSYEDFINVFMGEIPLGILPNKAMPCINKMDELVKLVKRRSSKKYANTDEKQKVETYGSNPFVDSEIVSGYLIKDIDKEIDVYMSEYVMILSVYLSMLGFEVEILKDPLTSLNYSAGVVRRISVSKDTSVLHVDDFVRDGNMKVDFRMPVELLENDFYQSSFNILLTDGGFQADPLYVYNSFYKEEDEAFCMANGWQFKKDVIEDVDSFKYQPKPNEGYIFSTSAYHDIYGGSKKADRITWSVFAIYVPNTNKVLLYN